MLFKTAKNYIHFSAVVLCLYIYFINSETVIASVKDGMNLCYNVVIPSLFVFMVICNIISNLNCCEMLAVPFMPYFRMININNRRIASYCIIAVLGGFATGGIMLDKIRSDFNCDKNTLDILSILMTGNSPSFVILAVGVHYLGSINLGVMIYLSITFSAFATAFIVSFIHTPNCKYATKSNLVITNNITVSIRNSVTAILNICGVVIITFSLCKVLSLYTNNSFILLIISALTEVTSACEFICNSTYKNIYLLSLILSLFPASAYLQFKSIGNNSTFSTKILFLSKLIHIPMSQLMLKTAVNLFPAVLNVYANGDISVNMYWNRPHISFFMFLISVCFIIFLDRKKEVFTNIQK